MSLEKTKAEDAALGLAILLGLFSWLVIFFACEFVGIYYLNLIPLQLFGPIPPTTFRERIAHIGCFCVAAFGAWVVYRLVLAISIKRLPLGKYF
jgi:hypothetical protein